MHRLPAIAAVLMLVSVGARAEGPTAYALDPVHTRVLVSIGHAGFSQALGTASGSEGALLFEPGDWTHARLDVRVPLDHLDFGDPDWNRAVQARNLLDTARFPDARFSSDSIEPIDDRRARVCGTLELRGVAKPQCLDVTLNAVERHPMPPFRRTAGFSATASLSRSDFGIDAWKSVIGDAVTLRIEAEAVRDADAARAFAPSNDEGNDEGDVTAPDADAYTGVEGLDVEAAAAAALQEAADADEAASSDTPPDEPEPMP